MPTCIYKSLNMDLLYLSISSVTPLEPQQFTSVKAMRKFCVFHYFPV